MDLSRSKIKSKSKKSGINSFAINYSA